MRHVPSICSYIYMPALLNCKTDLKQNWRNVEILKLPGPSSLEFGSFSVFPKIPFLENLVFVGTAIILIGN